MKKMNDFDVNEDTFQSESMSNIGGRAPKIVKLRANLNYETNLRWYKR